MNLSQLSADSSAVESDISNYRLLLHKLVREMARCFAILYSPRRVFVHVVPRATWGIPIVVIGAFVLAFGIADIISVLNRPVAGNVAAEMQRVRFTRVVSVLGGIIITLPFVLLARAALAAFFMRTVISIFETPPGLRSTLTIVTYALNPVLVQFTVAFIIARLDIFNIAEWSAVSDLPSLSTRFGADNIAQAFGPYFGLHLSYGATSAVNLLNPAECWKYLLVFLGLTTCAKIRPVVAALATLTPWLVEASMAYILFSAFAAY